MAIVKRKGGDTYLGGSTIIGPAGRWPTISEHDTKTPSNAKRFARVDDSEEIEAARVRQVEDARKHTAKRMAAIEKAESRKARLIAANAKVAAIAARAAETPPKAKTKPNVKRRAPGKIPAEQRAQLSQQAERLRDRVEVVVKSRGAATPPRNTHSNIGKPGRKPGSPNDR